MSQPPLDQVRPPGPWRVLRLMLAMTVRRWLNRLASARAKPPGEGSPPRRASRPRRAVIPILVIFTLVASTAYIAFGTWNLIGRLAMIQPHAAPIDPAAGNGAAPATAPTPGDGMAAAEDEHRPDHSARAISGDERDRILADAPTRAAVIRLLSAVLALIVFFVFANGLGLANQDLGQVEWSTLWLIAQPIADRTLFTVQVIQGALVSLLLWAAVPAYLGTIAWIAGAGWWCVPHAVLGTLALGLIVSAAQVATETRLRLGLSFAMRKNVQAACTVLGLGAMIVVYAAAFSMREVPDWFLIPAGALPWEWLPTGWLVRGGFDPATGWWWLMGAVAATLAVGAAAVAWCARLVARGFCADPGTRQGARVAVDDRAWRPLPLLGKDLLMLARDRSFLVQALAVPVFVVAMQFLVNPDLATAVAGNFRHACVFIFVVGAYVLQFGATSVLSSEGQALWLMHGAPRPLARTLLGKVWLWTGIATAYAVAGLVLAVAVVGVPGPAAIGDAVMVLVGLPAFAVIAAGIGAGAADPNASEPQRRLRPDALLPYLMLMGIYGQAVYTASAHARLAMLMGLAVLAYGLWQRLEELLPWILDPSQAPPRRLALADGALAALAFMGGQALLLLALTAAGLSMPSALPWAFAGSGALTVAGTLLLLWRAGAVDVLRGCGILPARRGSIAGRVVSGLAHGTIAGGLALGIAGFYLRVAAPWLPQPGAQEGADQLGATALIWLTVVAAPLCEEFIFRGLVFGGLVSARSGGGVRPWLAGVASAAIFALIHPTAGLVPVFALGLACAWAYHRTGWLLAPVAAHALYHAGVLMMG